MKLIILESPNKIKTLSKILGPDYTVLATAGHITIIEPMYAYKTGIDVQNDFKVAYKFDPSKKELLSKIKTAAKTAEEIFVCSDPDREGEKIADEVRELLKVHKKKIRRAVFNEITEKVVKAAIANPIPFDENLIQAAESRAIIDRITGYRCSNISLSKINCESVGRVQSALLRLICDKEREISKFKSKKYWDVFLDFKKGNKNLTAKLKEISGKKINRIEDINIASKVINDCNGNDSIVEKINEKEKLIEPKMPFTTSTLQQSASSVLGFSPQKTMTTAQHLFEKGYITYHRTDSVRFSEEFISECKNKIETDYDKKLFRGLFLKKNINEDSQNGHESIRPTTLKNSPEKISQFLDTSELKLYKLIYNRSLASVFVPAKVKDTEVIIRNGDYTFSISGRTIIFESFLNLYNDDTETNILPIFKNNEKINVKDIYFEEKRTLPPNRYSEAGLVKLMQDTKIGRPSTYAGTIETLKKREYISIDKKAVVATEKGLRLDNMLSEYFAEIINVNYTAEMENDLDKIANGTETKLNKLNTFWKEFEPIVLKAAREINKNKPKPEKAEGKNCPNCGATLVYRQNRKTNEKFLACSKFPKCKYVENLENKDEFIQCPECGDGHLIKRKSKKGDIFYGCSRYPQCKKTLSINDVKE